MGEGKVSLIAYITWTINAHGYMGSTGISADTSMTRAIAFSFVEYKADRNLIVSRGSSFQTYAGKFAFNVKSMVVHLSFPFDL